MLLLNITTKYLQNSFSEFNTIESLSLVARPRLDRISPLQALLTTTF